MRVISKSGEYDIPYELSVFWRDENIIWSNIPSLGKIIMAQYSTQEKAEKALQKLYDDYDLSKRFEALGYKAVENMISWNGKKETMNCLSGNIFSFRFPQEDEI